MGTKQSDSSRNINEEGKDLSKLDDNDAEMTDPSVSLRQKWNNHVTKKRKTGIVRHATFANRWLPRLFHFVCFGGTGWMLFGSIPYYYANQSFLFMSMEIYTIYALTMIMANYYLTRKVDSRYNPRPEEVRPIIEEKDVQNQTSPGKTSILDANIINNSKQKSELKDNVSGDVFNDSKPISNGCETEPTNRILVATSVAGNEIKRKSYDYWSWVPCMSCKRMRPPRCHHCSLCKKCVLKRDHHCYFTNACIGVYNHKYYMYLLFWSFLLAWQGSVQLIPFLFQNTLSKYSHWNIIFPINFLSTITGKLPLLYFYLITVVWGVFVFTFIGTGMFFNGVYLVLKGMTGFENNHKIKVIDSRNYLDRLRSVLGKNWAIELFIPLLFRKDVVINFIPEHLKPTDPLEDAIQWPYIKMQ